MKSNMATYVRSYLRPLSQIRTGNQSKVDAKAEKVETVTCPDVPAIEFEQFDTYDLWVNEQAHRGRRVVTSDREIHIERTVRHPERHWWIVSNGLLEGLDPPVREHADVFDLLIALNLCTDNPVFFSQNPGQVVGGAYTRDRGALRYRDDLSIGNIATSLLGMGEIPETIEITGDLRSVYENVRMYRSKRIVDDAEIDLRIALHMYDDALSADIWTTAANLYYVCENVLFSGRERQKDRVIAKRTALTEAEAKSWRESVNRLKHPDKGTDEGILDREGLEMPSLQRMKSAANTVLKRSMVEP